MAGQVGPLLATGPDCGLFRGVTVVSALADDPGELPKNYVGILKQCGRRLQAGTVLTYQNLIDALAFKVWYDIMRRRPRYHLTFSDGTPLYASSELPIS